MKVYRLFVKSSVLPNEKVKLWARKQSAMGYNLDWDPRAKRYLETLIWRKAMSLSQFLAQDG